MSNEDLKSANQSAWLTQQMNLNAAKTQAITGLLTSQMSSETTIQRLQLERDMAQKALQEANDIIKEWQASCDAWKDLAITLRKEIEHCPHSEQHFFGKNKQAREERFHSTENETRIKLGINPRYKK